MTVPENIALRFNEYITNADTEGLASLMTEDHRFVDSAGNIIDGREANTQNWKRFFGMFPGYRNIFESVVLSGQTVIMLGYSRCQDARLDNVCAIWAAEINEGKVSQWRVSNDTEENRKGLGI